MFGLGGPKRPRVVAFDVIGTLFPLEPLRPALVSLGLPAAGLEGWFAAGCRDAFALAAVGDYEPFAAVLEAALDGVLAEQRLDPPDHDRKKLMKRMEQLDVRDGAREAFTTLTEAGIPVMALSNGSHSSTKALLVRAELDGLVRDIVSVDEVKLAKPRSEVYAQAAETAGVEPAELALVAAHPWDINGAAAVGFVTAYLSADRPYSRVMRTPDLEAGTLSELAVLLASL